jgi:hypothetical protein
MRAGVQVCGHARATGERRGRDRAPARISSRLVRGDRVGGLAAAATITGPRGHLRAAIRGQVDDVACLATRRRRHTRLVDRQLATADKRR